MIGVLDPRQLAAADRLLDEESAKRRHLVVSLSGAHAYGFPSPDSDLDLKAIHLAPAVEANPHTTEGLVAALLKLRQVPA